MIERQDRVDDMLPATGARRRRGGLFLAGTVLAAGFLASAPAAFAEPDGYVLCKSNATDEVYPAEDDDCEYRYGAIGSMDFATATDLKVGNVQLSGPGGVSTFGGSIKVNSTVETTILDAHSGEFSTELKVLAGASINMGGNRITNVGTPTAGSDAATKDYVDGLIGSGTAKDAEQDARIGEVDNDSFNRDFALGEAIIAVAQDNEARNTAQDGLIATNADNIAANADHIAALGGTINGLDRRMTAGFARLDGRIDRAFEGAAMAMAMAAPSMPTDKNYAVSINWGGFEGKNAFAGTAQARVSDHFLIHGGIGYGSSSHSVGGRAGVTFAW